MGDKVPQALKRGAYQERSGTSGTRALPEPIPNAVFRNLLKAPIQPLKSIGKNATVPPGRDCPKQKLLPQGCGRSRWTKLRELENDLCRNLQVEGLARTKARRAVEVADGVTDYASCETRGTS